MHISIKTKIILLIILVVFLVSTAIGSIYVFDELKERKKFEDEFLADMRKDVEAFAFIVASPLIENNYAFMNQLVSYDSKHSYHAYVLITDNSGRILAHSDKGEIGKIFKIPSAHAGATTSEMLVQRYVKDGRELIDVSYPVRAGDLHLGTVRMGLTNDWLLEEIAREQQTVLKFILTAAGLIFLGVTLAIFIADKIAKPILLLKQMAENVGKGKYDQNINIQSNDEVGMLASSFYRMVADLQRTMVTKDYLDNIFKSMIDTLIVTSPEGIILRTNAAANMLLGYREEELAGLPVTTVINEKYPGNGPFSDDEFIAGFIGNRETIYVSKDGRKVPVMLSASIIQEASGNIQGIVCVAQDITSLRHAEEQLLDRAHQQEVIVELGHRALANDNLDELMDAAVTLVANTLGVKFCRILEFHAHHDSFLLKAGVGWNKELIGNSILQTGKDSQAGYTLLSREPVVVHDIREETRFSSPSMLSDHGVISGISVTIGDQQSPYGVLDVHAGTKRNFSKNDIKFLEAVSNILTEAIERKKSENILFQTKQDWEDTFNTITDMVTVHDKDYNIIRANKAAEKILGLSFLSKSAAKCFQYYHGTDAPPQGCPSCNCLKTKEPATFNIFEPHLNRFIEISSIPRIDGKKQLVGLIHIVRDITDRKKAEEKIMDSEAQYRSLLETASDLIQSVDINGRFLYVNKKWMDVTGYTMDDVKNMTFMDVLSESHRPYCAEIFGKLCAGEPVGQIETEFLTRDGTIVQVEGNINVQFKNGEFAATQGIFRDITARKQAETELTERMHHAALLADVGAALTQSDDLQTVLQSCTDSIVINLHAAFARVWTLNENGTVLELQSSSGMYTNIDGAHAQIPVGKLKIGRIALERKPYLTNNVFEDPEIGEPECARQNGLTAFAGHPLVVADKLVGVIALFHYEPIREITLNALSSVADEIAIGIERNNSKERLKEYSRKLKKSNEELEQFAYVASHDLQEPLRKVITFGDRLKTKYTDTLGENGRDYLERMQGAAMRMQTLINDLLTFSRVMTKAQPFAPVDLAEVAHDVVSDLEVRIEQSGAHIEVDKLEVIYADPLQMRQLLQNLIGNSLKFIKRDEPPVIKVSGIFINGNGKNGGSHSPCRDSYEITVEDNGIGFDEKYTDRIFGVFQRLHGRSEYEGTGIGLSICKKIVDRHNGSITAQSAPGKGARFIVVLPVKQNEGMTTKE